MRNRENYNEIMSFINEVEKRNKEKKCFSYNIKDFLIENEDKLLNGNNKIANLIYENKIIYDRGDNTYNYNSNIDNDINYMIYNIKGYTYVEFKLHKYGDIRANYTESIILKYDNEIDFLNSLDENTYFSVEIINENDVVVYIDCNLYDEIIRVYLNDEEIENNFEIDFYLYEDEETIKNKIMKFLKEKSYI